jgi:hypothetical protein
MGIQAFDAGGLFGPPNAVRLAGIVVVPAPTKVSDGSTREREHLIEGSNGGTLEAIPHRKHLGRHRKGLTWRVKSCSLVVAIVHA